jgi:hypothetical protein
MFDAITFARARNLARYLLGQSKRLHLDFSCGASDRALDADTAKGPSAWAYTDARKLAVSKAGLWGMKRGAAKGEPPRL